MKTPLAFVLVFGAGVAVVAQSDPPQFPKSPELREAKGRYDDAVMKARRTYEDAVTAARKVYLEELDKGVARATKSNDLDEAIRVREVRKFVESDSTQPRAPAGTREGAYAFKGGQYRVVLADVSWREAREACLKAGGDLASLDGREKRDFVAKLAGGVQLWVGAYIDPRTQRWQWTNGAAIAAESWSPGRPKNFGSFGVIFGKSGLLGDGKDQIADCKGYVCEWKR